MSGIIKYLFGDETYLSWFNPGDDGNDGIKIYLHINHVNISLRLKNNVSRHDIIQFIRKIHDEDLMKDQKEFKNRYFSLFHTEKDINKEELIKNLKAFRVFKKESILFVNTGTTIDVQQSDESGNWITRINKKNNDTINNVAIINNDENNPFII